MITGMSGTGKSTTIAALTDLGYKAIDFDHPGWSEYAGVPGPDSDPVREWVWCEDRVEELLSTEDTGLLFVSGCARNQVRFQPLFDHIVLLTASVPLTIERLRTRTTNPYGKDPAERAEVLANKAAIEPLLAKVATLKVDTGVPLDRVVATILDHVRAEPADPLRG